MVMPIRKAIGMVNPGLIILPPPVDIRAVGTLTGRQELSKGTGHVLTGSRPCGIFGPSCHAGAAAADLGDLPHCEPRAFRERDG